MTLATEEPTAPTPAPNVRSTMHETWSENERMRHVPPIAWIVDKIEGDLRAKIEKIWLPYSDLPASDPRHAPIEAGLRAFCRSIDRLADIAARRSRGNVHPPNDLHSRIDWSVSHAIASLTAADADLFARRLPFQTFERSNAEPLWASLLAAIQHVHRLVELVRPIDPGIDERIYEGLVKLSEPLRREPIA
jgi:hypothetical protein